MAEPSQSTTTGLLRGLRFPEESEAWQELDRRVRPILFAVARSRGLTSQSAADVAQETFLSFLRLYREQRYSRDRGGLRAWILGIAKRRVASRRRRTSGRVPTEPLTLDVPAGGGGRTERGDESRTALLEAALQRLESGTRLAPETVRAFRRVAIDGARAQDVAEEMGMTVNAVYLAKMHCIKHLRRATACSGDEAPK